MLLFGRKLSSSPFPSALFFGVCGGGQGRVAVQSNSDGLESTLRKRKSGN